jgi:hypothetical protein
MTIAVSTTVDHKAVKKLFATGEKAVVFGLRRKSFSFF